MIQIKFRQPLVLKGKFHSWHYWGFLGEGNFVAPTNDWVSGEPSLQYTGLKDKNGVEIYEGDVIDFENGYKSEVAFNDGRFGLDDGQYRNDLTHGIVIGNIYEHPELLTPPK